MRISDWSSDVCSSDLSGRVAEFAVTADVIGQQRLLHEEGLCLRKEAATLECLANRPFLVGVEQQPAVVADHLADSKAAFEILAQAGKADLELERGVDFGTLRPKLLQPFRLGEMQVDGPQNNRRS